MEKTDKAQLLDLFNSLKRFHPYLLHMLVWQEGETLLDESNPDARLDHETNLLKIFGKAFLGFMPFMKYPLSDFQGKLKNVRSVTKTITSLLAGAVFQADILDRLEDPIRTYFPEIPADDPKASIQLKHLLSNTSGLPSIDDFNSIRRLFSTKNWIRTILRYPLQAEPGQSYLYSSANFHLTTCLLQRTLGSNLLDFAEHNFFKPLGIADFLWETDPQGIPFGGSDLYLTPEAMLTIGKTCLNKGNWQGKQLIPEDWLHVATSTVVEVNEADAYGYGWWVDHNRATGCAHTYSACGVGGQRIIVIPEKETIVVTISLTSLNAHSDVIDDTIGAYFSR